MSGEPLLAGRCRLSNKPASWAPWAIPPRPTLDRRRAPGAGYSRGRGFSPGLFLHNGTPYQGAHTVATAHNPYVYNPYLPALAVFGVPHALFGGGLLTDPRLWFGVVFVLGFAGTLALSRVPRPWLWTAVVTASPIIAFPLSTGGD